MTRETREETIQEYAKRQIEPHLQEIKILSKQMRDVISGDVINEVEEIEIANLDLIYYHIDKILEHLS